MKGIKCPICLAISIVKDINEGEMIRCAYCKSKYTIIPKRLYSVVPKGLKKNIQENINYHELEEYLKEIDNEGLAQIIKITSDELFARYKKK